MAGLYVVTTYFVGVGLYVVVVHAVVAVVVQLSKCTSVMYDSLVETCCRSPRILVFVSLINPRRACARVTVVVLCVYLCVCLSVCLSVCPSVTALAASASAYTCDQLY